MITLQIRFKMLNHKWESYELIGLTRYNNEDSPKLSLCLVDGRLMEIIDTIVYIDGIRIGLLEQWAVLTIEAYLTVDDEGRLM